MIKSSWKTHYLLLVLAAPSTKHTLQVLSKSFLNGWGEERKKKTDVRATQATGGNWHLNRNRDGVETYYVPGTEHSSSLILSNTLKNPTKYVS